MARTELVATRVTPREKALILAAATAEGVSVSSLVADILLEGVRRRLQEDASPSTEASDA